MLSFKILDSWMKKNLWKTIDIGLLLKVRKQDRDKLARDSGMKKKIIIL